MTEAIGQVAGHVKELFALLEDANAVENVDETVEHLKSSILDAMVLSRASAERCMALICSAQNDGSSASRQAFRDGMPSLVGFLDASTQYEEHVHKKKLAMARVRVLDLLVWLLVHFRQQQSKQQQQQQQPGGIGGGNLNQTQQQVIAKCFGTLFTKCQLIARTDASNRIKSVATEVVFRILKYGSQRDPRRPERLQLLPGTGLSAQLIDATGYLEKLFRDLKFSKMTQTAKGSQLELMGLLISIFPHESRDTIDPLFVWIEHTLEQQFASNSPEVLLVKGLLICLSHLLMLQPHRYNSLPKQRQALHSYLNTVMATTTSGQLSRFQVSKAAQFVLTHNSRQIRDELGKNTFTWYLYMKHCFTTDSKTLKANAFKSADAVLKECSAYLALNHSEETTKRALHRILKEILPALNDPQLDKASLSFAVLCLGKFAKPIQLVLGTKGFMKIDEKLIKFGDALLANSPQNVAAKWSLYSQYLDCVGQFIRVRSEFCPLDEAYIAFVGDFMAHVMDAYVYCVWKQKQNIAYHFLVIFRALTKQEAVYLLIDRFVFKTLLLTISNLTDPMHMVPIYHPETGNLETKLLYDLEGFWTTLLRDFAGSTTSSTDPKGSKSLDEAIQVSQDQATNTADEKRQDEEEEDEDGNSREVCGTILRVLFDALIKSVLQVVDRLDLSYHYQLEALDTGVNATGFKPHVARDHSIMLNLTEFFCRLMPKLPLHLFTPWMEPLLMKVFTCSRRYPLVSAFYHLGRELACISEQLEVFKDNKASSQAERQRLSAEYHLFIAELAPRMRFYKDELLAGCIAFLLATPLALVEIEQLVPSMKTGLAMGKSYLPIAENCLTVLEYWFKCVPEQLDEALKEIAPLFGAYLEPTSDAHEAQLTDSQSVLESDDFGESSSEFKQLQHRLLRFLGKCGGRASLHLSRIAADGLDDDPENPTVVHAMELQQEELVVSFAAHTQLSGSQTSQSLELSLTELVGQVGTLALESTNRKVKTSASELYHAMLCYLCGKTASSAHDTGSKSDYYSLWQQVFPVLIRLGVDPEKVCRQLFKPLVLQLIRWFSANSSRFPHEHSMILDELVLGLGDARNGAIREFAAKSLAQFLVASIHSNGSAKNLAQSPIASIFDRLFVLCRHASPAKRLGAATALMYFLRDVGEERNELLATFALRFVKSLLLAQKLGGGEDSQSKSDLLSEFIDKAIGRLRHVIVNSAHLWACSSTVKSNKQRRGLVARGEDQEHTEVDQDDDLNGLTEWLFRQLASKERSYRLSCRKLFVAFASASVASGCKTCQEWMLRLPTTNGADNEPTISQMLVPSQVLVGVTDFASCKDRIDWLNQVSACLDNYAWCDTLLGDKAQQVLYSSSWDLRAKRKHSTSELAAEGIDAFDQKPAIFWVASCVTKFELAADDHTDRKSDASAAKCLVMAYDTALIALCQLVERLVIGDADKLRHFGMENTLLRDVCRCLLRRLANQKRWDKSSMEFQELLKRCQHLTKQSELVLKTLSTESVHVMQVPEALSEFHAKGIAWPHTPESVLGQVHTHCSLLIQIFALGGLEAPKNSLAAKQHGDLFAGIAGRVMELAGDSPFGREVATLAFQAACLFHWDVTLLIQDARLRAYFARISNEIELFLSNARIWRVVAPTLIQKCPKDVQLLRVLVNVLGRVNEQSQAAMETSEWDAFVESFLPSMKQLFTYVTPAASNSDTAQSQRLVLKSLGESLGIFTHCSDSLIELLAMSFLQDLCDVMLALLSRKEIQFMVKADALELMAASLSHRMVQKLQSSQTDPTEKFVEAMRVFGVEEFPIVSTDVAHGSRDYEIFSALFSKFLLVIQQSGQVAYLKLLVPSLKEGKKHLFYAEMEQALCVFVTNLVGHREERVNKVLMQLLELLWDPSVAMMARQLLLQQVFVPLLEFQQPAHIGRFFMMEFTAVAKVTMINKVGTLITNAGDIFSKESFFATSIAFVLVELMYRRVDAEMIRGEINNLFLGHSNGKGREFTMLVCKSASKFLSKDFNLPTSTRTPGEQPEDDESRVARECFCQAYNCLLIAVAKTQKQEKFFDQILFQDSIWPKIMDCSRQYALHVETPRYDKVNILSGLSVTTCSKYALATANRGGRSPASQSGVGTSSLDFFAASSLSQNSTLMMTSTFSLSTQTLNGVAGSSTAAMRLDIELDELNQHPCMVPLLRVLLQMQTDFGSNWQANKSNSMPGWMTRLWKVVSNEQTPFNIRLFLVKIVLNVPMILKGFGSFWLEPTMKVVLDSIMQQSQPSSSSMAEQDRAGEFHFLLRDFCRHVLEVWTSDVPVVPLLGTASRFVNQLVQLSPHENNAIRQDNLVLIHDLLSNWVSQGVTIDYNALIDLLFSSEESERMEIAKRCCALQILSSLIALNSMDDEFFEHKAFSRSIWDGVLKCLETSKAQVYAIAGEVIGLILKSRKKYPKDSIHQVETQASEVFRRAYNQEDYLHFLRLVRSVSLHEPRIVDEAMLHKMAFLLPKAVAIDKWSLLASEILFAGMKNPKVVAQLPIHLRPVWIRLLQHRNDAVQYVILQLLHCINEELQFGDVVNDLLGGTEVQKVFVEQFERHRQDSTRQLYYETLMKWYKPDRDNADRLWIKDALLRGLVDPDPVIKAKLHDFWNDARVMPIEPHLRLNELLDLLQTPSSSAKWVNFAAFLLLRSGNSDPQALETKLFEKPLSDASFQELAVDANWESSSQAMMPLFSVEAEQLSSAALLTQMESTQMDSLTQSALATQSQLDTDQTQVHQSQLVASQGSASGEVVMNNNGSASVLSQFGNGPGASPPTAGSFHKKRFAKYARAKNKLVEQEKIKQHFQQYYLQIRRSRVATRTRQRQARQKQVSMRRKYRVGEYPDIELRMCDLVYPLLELCEKDTTMARLVFVNLFGSILRAQSTLQDSSFIQQVARRLETALMQSKQSIALVACLQSAIFEAINENPQLLVQLSLSSQSFGEASLSCGDLYNGEMILEVLLNQHLEGRVTTANTSKEIVEAWDQLYRVVSTLQDKHLLASVSETTSTIEQHHEALQARLTGNLSEAIALYKEAEHALAGENASEGVPQGDDENTLHGNQLAAMRCYWERLNCLGTLNSWNKLQREIEENQQNEDDDELAFIWKQEPPYLDQLLGLYLHSNLGMTWKTLSLHQLGDDSPELQLREKLEHFVDLYTNKRHTRRQTSNEEPWELLKSKFAVETSLICLRKDDFAMIRSCLEEFMKFFLQQWSHTSRSARLSRLELLQSLSSIIEIDEGLELLRSASDGGARLGGSAKHCDPAFKAFAMQWTRFSGPSVGQGTISIWSKYFQVQQNLLRYVSSRARSMDVISQQTQTQMIQQELETMLLFAKAAVSVDLLPLASKYLKEYRERCVEEKFPKVNALMIEVYVSHILKMADRLMIDLSKQQHEASARSSLTTKLTRYFQTATRMFENEEVTSHFTAIAPHERFEIVRLEAQTFASSAEFYLLHQVDESLGQHAMRHALETFESTLQVNQSIKSLSDDGSRDWQAMNQLRASFVGYLMDLLYGEHHAMYSKLVNRKQLMQQLIEMVLTGMASCSKEIAVYFPQCLEMLVEFPVMTASFEKQVVTTVPSWTYLRWSAQMMSLVSSKIGKMILSLLEKTAKEYPVALFYDFKLTLSRKDDEKRSEQQLDLSRLEALIANPVMEKFVDALHLIHHPELRLKEGLRQVAKLMEQNKTLHAKQLLKHTWEDCLAMVRPLLGSQIGRYNREWARKSRKDLEKLLGKEGTANVTSKSVASALNWIANHFGVVAGKYGIGKDMKAKLSDFAEWLHEFDPSKSRVELPGQYGTSWGKPDPSRHVYIVGFGAALWVLASKQLPKRITLHCSDEKEYTFLVKGGEDLRLDQRIEQLFNVMNQVLLSDPNCKDRELHTPTYKVIPMTQETGLIEWVHNTCTLKMLIEHQLKRDLRCTSGELKANKRGDLNLFNTKPAQQYESFILKQRGQHYNMKITAFSPEASAANLHAVQAMIPGDLLRKQLLALCGNDAASGHATHASEKFFEMRGNFAKSMAVLNCVGYLLGIGDRHMDNFLVELHSGKVLAIDFGVSFGAGASILPVPEMIPFRWTRQLEFVLHPFDGKSLLLQDMTIVLQALRARKQMIQSVLNVFLHEPLAEWRQTTKTQQQEIFRDDDAVDATGNPTAQWLPEVKITIARRKLEGFAPRVLLKEELSQNVHLNTSVKQKLDEFLEESQQGMMATSRRSTNQLAQELLDMATDPSLLGRTYHGWMPWV